MYFTINITTLLLRASARRSGRVYLYHPRNLCFGTGDHREYDQSGRVMYSICLHTSGTVSPTFYRQDTSAPYGRMMLQTFQARAC